VFEKNVTRVSEEKFQRLKLLEEKKKNLLEKESTEWKLESQDIWLAKMIIYIFSKLC